MPGIHNEREKRNVSPSAAGSSRCVDRGRFPRGSVESERPGREAGAGYASCRGMHRRVLLQGLLPAVRPMREVAGDELLRLIVGRASGRPIQGRPPRPSNQRSSQPLARPATIRFPQRLRRDLRGRPRHHRTRIAPGHRRHALTAIGVEPAIEVIRSRRSGCSSCETGPSGASGCRCRSD